MPTCCSWISRELYRTLFSLPKLSSICRSQRGRRLLVVCGDFGERTLYLALTLCQLCSADHHKHVGSTAKAAKDVQAFVTLFFETFSDLKGRPFHFAGEVSANHIWRSFCS